MSIKAHCMGMEFPKRDTDSPNVKWSLPTSVADILRDAQNHLLRHYVGGEPLGSWLYESGDGQAFRILAAVSHHFAEKGDDLSDWKVKE